MRKLKSHKKFGFTLIELLAVIIILAIVALIATPIILDVVEDARISAGKSESQMILSGINNYCASSEMKKQMGTLGSEDIDCSIKTSFTEEEIGKMLNLGNAKIISNSYSDGKVIRLVIESNNHTFTLCGNSFVMDSEECNELPEGPEQTYQDNSGANIPELLDNMVPIKYENDNWIVADVSQKWYDYDAKEWANAVVLNTTKNVGEVVTEDEIDLWYVWIPRYKYQLFNADNGSVNEQEIQIEFESGTTSTGTVSCTDNISGTDGTTSSETCTNASNGNWYTHPAFTFGEQKLTGFWVGKFEVSGSISKITIKPNVISLRSTSVSNFFTAIQNINTTYNLNGDSHMMKNMEWGAVAYLSHSKYGTCTDGSCVEVGINNNSSYITGCGAAAGSSSTSSCNAYNTTTGMLASTTGNIYGVYDMSGGAYEYVMGNMVNSSGSFYSSNAGFSGIPNSIYYDSYTYGTSYINHGRGKLGDATKETLKIFGNNQGGWYNKNASFLGADESWFFRGGCYNIVQSAGLFSFVRYDGILYTGASTRSVLCNDK